MKSVGICSDELWDKLCIKANHAVVFMDNACAEILHWNRGLGRLMAAGVIDIRELSSFESAKPCHKKGMFVTSGILSDMTGDTIRDIIQASHFQYVIVITSVSPSVHLYNQTGSMEGDETAVFEHFEDKILEWMRNMNFTAEVFHMPLFTASIGSNMFVTPAFSDIFPLVETDLQTIRRHYKTQTTKVEKKVLDSLNDVELIHFPVTTQLLYKKFVNSLHGFLDSLGVREDVYCVGQTSRMLAVELENYPPAKLRRKNATNRASVVLVDRTLDLTSAVGHQGNNLLDRIISLLPRLPGHHSDVEVNMSPLCSVNNDTVLMPGCLAGPTPLFTTYLDTLVTSKPKEALMEIHRNLVEAAAAESLPLSLSGKPGRVTAEQILHTITLFRGKYKAIGAHLDTLQIAIATAAALQHQENSHYDCLSGLEKGLVQIAGDQGEISVLAYLKRAVHTDAQKPKDERLYNLDDVWSLLVYAYALCGGNCVNSLDEERQFQTFLIKQIIEEKDDLPPFTKSLIGETVTMNVVSTIVELSWDKLTAVGSTRENLKQFRSILDPGNPVNPASHKPFVKQLIDSLLDPSKPELVDLEYKSSGFKDILKSSFSLFMSVTKPRPSDHPLLLLFMVGGMTPSEMKYIRDAIHAQGTNMQVLIGSTKLIRPVDILESIFCQDNVYPGVG